ncbi:cell division protein PerM [Arthrobacter monumenti]
MKLNQERRLPMPLWLQGAFEFAQVALISAILILLPLVAVWLTDGFADRSFDSLARLGGHAWLLIHGVPLDLQLAAGTTSRDMITGVISLTPLGLTLIPFLLAWRAGRRLARASYTDQLWQAGLGALIVYAAVGAGTGFITESVQVSTSLAQAALIPLIPAGAGLIIGARREAGSWARLIGVDAAEWIATTSQHSRWAGSYVWTVVRAAYLALMTGVALAALLMTVSIGLHWSDIVTVYEGLAPGIVGGAVLTVVELGLLTNFVFWTFSWASGAGFALGEGSLISPLVTQVGPLPAYPVFAALPTGELAFGLAALLIPVVGGLLAGWWFLREGENHFDEWLEIKIHARWFTAAVSTLVLGIAIGVIAGLMAAVATWISRGSIAIGRFTEIGPDPWMTALWVGAEVAVGVVLGYALAPLFERDPETAEDLTTADR